MDRLRSEERRTEVRFTLINTYYENETTAFELVAKAEDDTVLYEERRKGTKGHSFTTEAIPNEVRTVEYRTDDGASGTVSILPKSDCPPRPSEPREIELTYKRRGEMAYEEDRPSCE
ncbi:hypothetical protein C478_17621 [Natrinema thermotolerans DSM 11552]|nr:hypothetical protein C478_17621 [Natrinema thermotolerans DSM 11552]